MILIEHDVYLLFISSKIKMYWIIIAHQHLFQEFSKEVGYGNVFCYKDLGFYMFSSSLNGVLHILWHIMKVSLNWKGCLAVKDQNKNSLGTTSCSVKSFEGSFQIMGGENHEWYILFFLHWNIWYYRTANYLRLDFTT